MDNEVNMSDQKAGELEAQKMMRIKIAVTVLLIVAGAAVFFKTSSFDNGYTLKQKADKDAGYSWVYEVSDPAVLSVKEDGYKNGKYVFLLTGKSKGAVKVDFKMIKNGDESKVYKEKIYSFEINEDKGILFKKMKVYDD